jgi:Zn-dependent peptidase ImmA (M78 family)
MKYILNRLERYGIGLRPMTEDDFFKICEAENIEVVWSDKKFSFYLADPELDIYCITLPKRRRGLRLLFDMFHELGHHFTHVGNDPVAAFSGLTDDKDELEADAISLVAMIPKDQIVKMARMDNTRFGDKLWKERCRLYFLYRI